MISFNGDCTYGLKALPPRQKFFSVERNLRRHHVDIRQRHQVAGRYRTTCRYRTTGRQRTAGRYRRAGRFRSACIYKSTCSYRTACSHRTKQHSASFQTINLVLNRLRALGTAIQRAYKSTHLRLSFLENQWRLDTLSSVLWQVTKASSSWFKKIEELKKFYIYK